MASDNDYTVTIDAAEEERMGAIGDKWKELSALFDYPPFTLYQDRLNKVLDVMNDVMDEMNQERNKTNVTPDAEKVFAPVEDQFADDLEEARLYQKRYPNSRRDAQRAAMKIDELKDDYPGLTHWPE